MRRINFFLTRFDKKEGLQRAAKAALNLALILLWIWLYRPVLTYLAVIFTREEFRTNQIVLAAVTALLLQRGWKSRSRFHIDTAPHLYWPGLILALSASLAYLAVERWLDINTLSAILFGLASYGLLGLWLNPLRWRQGFPAMLLVVGVLPFGEHMETFVGYPLRKFTAALVQNTLGQLGFQAVGVDTILLFESGISQVDIPCSGVKSLWTGALFLVAATWIENRRINLRWLWVAVILALLLFVSNYMRVAILTLTGPALGWDLLARMIHLPMGVLGFIGSCLAALWLLRRLPSWPENEQEAAIEYKSRNLARPVWLRPLVGLCVLGMALVYTPNTSIRPVSAAAPPRWIFADGLTVTPASLTEKELAWVRQDGAETADRYTFEWLGANGKLSGVVLLLTSQTWRGQHRPERCFEVFGFTVYESQTYLVSPEFPLRILSLTGMEGTGQANAAYWLQSAGTTTDDFGRRIWADMQPQKERWVLVTVLFDRDFGDDTPYPTDFFTALHASVARSLMEGEMP